MSLSHNHGNRPCQPYIQVHGQRAHFRVSTSLVPRAMTVGETACAHAFKIRKWRPTQLKAVGQRCEQLF